MQEKRHDKSIVRYTLQSFVGPHISDMKISQRQKDAIQRLIYLSDEKFEGLCEDIVNEIHHRSGMQHVKEGPMYEKLTKLNDEKFKNLVVDTLLVYNYRNPGTEVLHLDDFLANLQSLIEDLKSQSEGEKFISKIKGMGFVNVMQEYNKYVKRAANVDSEITAAIDRVIAGEMDAGSNRLLECLSYPEAFLEKVDGSEIGENEEYRFHRDSVLRALGAGREDKEPHDRTEFSCVENMSEHLRSQVVKTGIMQILFLLINRANIPAKSIDTQYPEIFTVLNALDSIKDDLKGSTCTNLEIMSEELNAALDSLIDKFSTTHAVDEETINNIKLHRVSIEGMKEAVTKHDAFKLVVSLAKDLQSVFKHNDMCQRP